MLRFWLTFVVSICLLSCYDGDIIESEDANSCSSKVSGQMQSFSKDIGTRAQLSDNLTAFYWDYGDQIGVFYKDSSLILPARYTTLDGGETNAEFCNSAFELKGDSKYYSYFPISEDIDTGEISVNYLSQKQDGNGNTDHLGAYNYMYAEATTNHVGGVNFEFKNLGAIMQLKVKAPATDMYKEVIISTQEKKFLTKGKIAVGSDKMIPIEMNSSISLALGEGMEVQAGEYLNTYIFLAPVDLSNDSLTIQLVSESGTYAFPCVKGKKMEAGKAYSYAAENVGKLKILCIGNSYSVDSFVYLPDLLKGAGIESTVGVMYIGGCSLETHVKNWATSAKAYGYFKNVGNGWYEETNCDIGQVMASDDWDIVCFHQVSDWSGIYSTIKIYLQDLITKTKSILPNVKLAYMMTPAWGAHNKGYGSNYENQLDMYTKICETCKDVEKEFDFDYLIPVATTVQNARNTSLVNYGDDLFASSTDRHLEDGIGRLLGAYTVYLTFAARYVPFDRVYDLFLPIYNVNVINEKYPQTSPFSDVTLEMVTIGKRCAEQAMVNMFGVSNLD